MNICKKYLWFKVIAFMLINSLLLLDVAWAGAGEITAGKPSDTLSAPEQVSQEYFTDNFAVLYSGIKQNDAHLIDVTTRKPAPGSKLKRWQKFVVLTGALMQIISFTPKFVLNIKAETKHFPSYRTEGGQKYLMYRLFIAQRLNFDRVSFDSDLERLLSLYVKTFVSTDEIQEPEIEDVLLYLAKKEGTEPLLKILAGDSSLIPQDLKEYYLDILKSKVIRLLGLLGERKAVPMLVEIIKGDPEGVLVPEAVIALGLFKDKRAIKPLKGLVKHDFSYGYVSLLMHYYKNKKSIKTMAAESLAMIGGEDVFKFLMDEFNKRNVSVIGALGIMKDERAVRPLLERLNDLFCEEHDAIRLALDNIRNKNSHDVGAEVNNLILKLILKQNNSGMKEMDLIISELRKIGTKKARFFAYLDEHRRNKYKDFMMSTFIDAESSSWVKEILENYNNYTDTPILYNAFRLLPEFKNADEFIPALINILRSTEDRELKWGYVADALGRIGDESALKELESQMRLIEELIAKSSENDVRYWEQYLYVVESAISRILGRKTNLAVGAGIDQNTIQFVKQSI